MKFNIVKALIFFSILVSFSLGGCANTPPTHFYLLKPVVSLDPFPSTQAAEDGTCILIGPITIPDYLERPFIVTRLGENKLQIDEFHQWAEPLERNLARVLGENLSQKLTTEQITYFPARQASPVDYRIIVDVIRFDSSEDGEAELIARWRVLNGESGEVVFQKRSRFSETASQLTYDAIAASMSAILGKLSMEIASVIEDDR